MDLAVYQFVVTDDQGNILPGANVTVHREAMGLPLAQIWSDRGGTVNPGNPFQSDAEGYAQFYVAGGRYRIIVTSGEFTRTFSDVAIGTMQEHDVEEFFAQATTVSIPEDYANLGSAIADLDNKVLLESVTINVADEEVAETDDIVLTNADFAGKLRIVGANMPVLTLNSVGAITGSTKAWDIVLNLANASSLSVGNYLRIQPSDLSGTGRYQELAGVWKITAINTNAVTIRHHSYVTSWPALTASGTIKRVASLLRFPTGTRGIVVESGCYIENLHWAQEFDPATDTPSDSPDDGFQIGSAPDTTTTGLTQSERFHGASVFTRDCGCLEWPGNGVQVLAGTEESVAFMACSNGHRGHQVASGGKTYNFLGVAAANAASNYQSERTGSLEIPACIAYGGGDQNIFSLSNGTVVITNGYLGSSPTASIDGRKGALIDVTSTTNHNDGAAGVLCDNARIELDTTTTLGGTTGWLVRNAGIIDGHSASVPTASTPYNVDHASGANIVDPTGNLVYAFESTPLEASGGNLVKLVVSSVGDVFVQFDTGAGFESVWSLRSDGTIYPITSTPTLGRPADPIGFGYFKRLRADNLPTTAAGLSSGDLWNDSGTVKIV